MSLALPPALKENTRVKFATTLLPFATCSSHDLASGPRRVGLGLTAALAALALPLLAGCSSASSTHGATSNDTEQDAATSADGGCSGNGCIVVLASGQAVPTCIATDGQNVYWTNQGGGSDVMQVSIPSGTPLRLATGGETIGIATDGLSVYWYDNSALALDSTPVGGGAITKLNKALDINAYGIATDGTNLYWADPGGQEVNKIPVSGGAPITVAIDQTSPTNIVTDGTNLYWTNPRGGTVVQASVNGGTSTTLASGQASPYGIATDGVNVYWTNGGTGSPGAGSVMQVPVSGGTLVTLAASQYEPNGIATDGANVYWDDYMAGTVTEVAIGGGTPTTLATGQTYPGAMTTDGHHIFWINLATNAASSQGSILELTLQQ
jgi:hypothetical protein